MREIPKKEWRELEYDQDHNWKVKLLVIAAIPYFFIKLAGWIG